jgi:hypothetical protein
MSGQLQRLAALPLGLHHSYLMMEAVRASETSVDNHFTRQYIPEDNSEHLTSRRENLKSHEFLPALLLGVSAATRTEKCGR